MIIIMSKTIYDLEMSLLQKLDINIKEERQRFRDIMQNDEYSDKQKGYLSDSCQRGINRMCSQRWKLKKKYGIGKKEAK